MDLSKTQDIESVFAGGSEMAARMRALDWSATPIGSVENWPPSLRICVRIVLGSVCPMCICWGPDSTLLYNDGYRQMFGVKHPAALGRKARQVVPEAWDFARPRYDRVLTKVQDSILTDQLVPLNRNGYLEECYFVFSYSPIPDDKDGVGGVLSTALETTERVIEDRRRRMLRDLASRTEDARNPEEVWRASAETLGEHRLSAPFAFLYECRPSGHQAYLVGASVETDSTLHPAVIDCDRENLWRFDRAIMRHGVVVDLGNRASGVSVDNWQRPPKQAAVVPIRLEEHSEPAGFLVAGIHPGRVFDDAHRRFVNRIAEQIAHGLANAREYERPAILVSAPEDEEPRVGGLQASADGYPVKPFAARELLARIETNPNMKNPRRETAKSEEQSGDEVELERQRLRKEAYFEEAQRLSHTGSFGWKPSTGEIIWSVETFRIFQYARTTKPTIELILQRVHPEDSSRVRQAVERASKDGKEYEHEYRLMMPDGSVTYLHVIARPFIDESGHLEFVGAVMDVTARKQVEETLREREAYLAEAQRLTHTGSGAWRVAGDDAVYLSDEWYRIYGFDPTHGLSAWRDRLDRMHPEDQKKVQEQKDNAIRRKSDYEVEHRILLPDGTLKYTHTIGHPVLNASGEVEKFVCTMMDITERKQAEEAREALRQTQADLLRLSRVTTMGELTASLAHELSQPITAASIDAKTCLLGLTPETLNIEDARVIAGRLVQEIKRAVEIINRIRQIFKKGTLQRELVDVNEIIREMIALLSGETAHSKVLVAMDLTPDLPHVMGDRVQLQQVLMNLMVNAIDAMKDVDWTRKLIIKSQRETQGRLAVSVADTGVGLPQQAEQIFDPFFTTKPQGTGMGLRISRSIIESHGGHLWASQNVPHGASFHFTLPIGAEAHE